MQLRVINHSYVIDFMDVDFDSNRLNNIVKADVDTFVKTITEKKLEDWELSFSFIYNTAREILISKRKSYPLEKYVEITIHIPIPILSQASWGVKENQWIYKLDHFDTIAKNFDRLIIDYTLFNNRAEYIIDCMRRSIAFCLSKGVTVNGVKINDNAMASTNFTQ